MSKGRDDRMKDAFESAAQRFMVDPPGAADVLRQGRKRRRARAAAAAGAGIVAALVIFGATAVVADWVDSDADLRVTPAQGGGPSQEGSAGVFAFLALDDAGLLDLAGDYYGIEEVQAHDDGSWRVELQPRKCVTAEVLETCVKQNGDPFIEVAIAGREFEVTQASPEIPDRARRSLRDFRRPTDVLVGDRWVFSTPQIHTAAPSPHIDVAMAWLGGTDPSRSAQICRGAILDSTGGVIWTSDWREFPRPSSNDTRFGGTSGFSGLPEDMSAADEAEVECEEIHGLGWSADDATFIGDEDPQTKVQLFLVWEAPAYLRHYTRCDVTVLDGQGNEIGGGEHWRPGPRAGSPPFSDTVVVETDAEASSASDVEVTCEPVLGTDFEARPPEIP